MEPLISLRVREPHRVYHPGDLLECEYQIDAVEPDEIQAVEASVLWYTEGKGDEDMTVHYFLRLTPDDVEDGDLRPQYRFSTTLPNSPLSYSGQIVKIRWCLRLRVFLGRGRQITAEQVFRLGAVPAYQRVAS